MKPPGLLLLVLWPCVIASVAHGVPRGAEPQVLNVAGFRLDTSQATSAQVAATLPSLRHQIDIVESVGLPAEVLEFFHSVPLKLEPSMARADGQPVNGAYSDRDGRGTVFLRPGEWPPERAILLHELLHAYHRKVLQQPAPPIGKAYTEAHRDGVYPAEYREAYFLSNGREYFAVIGEAYLTGRPVNTAPFTCAAVQQAQPEFVEYLATLFGRHECQGGVK